MSSSLCMTAMPVIHVCNISVVVSVGGDRERNEALRTGSEWYALSSCHCCQLLGFHL